MIPLSITPNIAAAPWTDLKSVPELGQITRIGRLPKGTAAGRSTVSVVIEFEDGRRFIGQTTLALLNGAMVAINASAEAEGEVFG